MLEKTLSIIKPSAVEKRYVGEIISRFEKENIRIIAIKMKHLSKKEAEGFYEVHRGRPFFDELTTYMSSGPVIVMVLEGEDVILRNRELMGDTNPALAKEGTIRKAFGIDKMRNAVHGSDSKESAEKEIKYFFSTLELCSF